MRMNELGSEIDELKKDCVRCSHAADEAEFAAQSLAGRVADLEEHKKAATSAMDTHKERVGEHHTDIGDLKVKMHRAEHHIARMAPYHTLLTNKYAKWAIGMWVTMITLASLFTLVDHKEIVFKLLRLAL
jgi:chromosome segregation ATPase